MVRPCSAREREYPRLLPARAGPTVVTIRGPSGDTFTAALGQRSAFNHRSAGLRVGDVKMALAEQHGPGWHSEDRVHADGSS